jgi:hypothetical protein
VTALVGDELHVRAEGSCGSGWNDYFKEHESSVSTAVAMGVIKTKPGDGDAPILIYEGEALSFVGTDDRAAEKLFSDARAEMARLKTAG